MRRQFNATPQTHAKSVQEVSAISEIKESVGQYATQMDWCGDTLNATTSAHTTKLTSDDNVNSSNGKELSWKRASNRWNLYQRGKYLGNSDAHPINASKDYKTIDAQEIDDLNRACKRNDQFPPKRTKISQSRFGETKQSMQIARRGQLMDKIANAIKQIQDANGIDSVRAAHVMMKSVDDSLGNNSNFVIDNVMSECSLRLRALGKARKNSERDLRTSIRNWRSTIGQQQRNYLKTIGPSLQPLVPNLTPHPSTTHMVRYGLKYSTQRERVTRSWHWSYDLASNDEHTLLYFPSQPFAHTQ